MPFPRTGPVRDFEMMDRVLLWAGIAGSLIFVATVLLGAMAYPGYSHLSNAVSELGQRGAPHAVGVATGFGIAAFLSGAFGLGVIRAARPDERMLRLAGWLLVAYAVPAILSGTVFPMDPFGTGMTLPGILHSVFVALAALSVIALLVVGGRALRARHRWFTGYSGVSIAAMLAGGALSGISGFYGMNILGAAERLTQASYLLWMMVFAGLLLKHREAPAESFPGTQG